MVIEQFLGAGFLKRTTAVFVVLLFAILVVRFLTRYSVSEYTVPVLNQHVDIGQKLTPDMFVEKKVAADYFSAFGVGPQAAIVTNAQDLAGKYALTQMNPGQPIPQNSVTDKEPLKLPYQPSDGHAPYTLLANSPSLNSVSYLVQPGTYIDLLVTENGNTPLKVETINALISDPAALSCGDVPIRRVLHHVRVLDKRDQPALSYVLDLTPEDIAKVLVIGASASNNLTIIPSNDNYDSPIFHCTAQTTPTAVPASAQPSAAATRTLPPQNPTPRVAR